MADPELLISGNGGSQFEKKPFLEFFNDFVTQDIYVNIVIPVFSATKTAIHLVNPSTNSMDVEIYGTLAQECPDYDTVAQLRDDWHRPDSEVIAGGADKFETLTDPYTYLLIRVKNTTPGSAANLRLRVREIVES